MRNPPMPLFCGIFLVLPNLHSCLYDLIDVHVLYFLNKTHDVSFIDQFCDNYKLSLLRTIVLCCYYNTTTEL